MPHDIEVLLRELNQDFMGWQDPPNRLLRALERDELVLYAQPILALRGEQTFPMAEVLVRLQDDDAVFLPPGGFLPLFEHFQLLPKLDRWVARQTIARLARSPRVPKERMIVLDALRKQRNLADYQGDTVPEQTAAECFAQAQQLLAEVKAWLAANTPKLA